MARSPPIPAWAYDAGLARGGRGRHGDSPPIAVDRRMPLSRAALHSFQIPGREPFPSNCLERPQKQRELLRK